MPDSPVFETARLRARHWRLDDAAAAYEMYGDPQVVRYIGNRLEPDVAATRARIEELLARELPIGMGGFPLIEKASGELVGLGLIKPLPDGDQQPTADIEVGWHLARRHWGKGFASEAGHALLFRGFVTLDLDRLHAVVDPANEPSHRVALRIGMEAAGRTSAYYGQELEHYVLERQAWRARGQG